ncbi:MAG TPA: DNA primase [Firmicutes bacterium]|nr:DNA primase [Bacillota bacterium]
MNLNIDELRKKVDIVKVISNFIEVNKKGANYEAICPFHNDTRPSLKISPTKQIFNCFVCHTGGDAFVFVEKYLKIPYIEAVKKACDICGVKTDIVIKKDQVFEDNKDCFSALEDAAKYYQFYLKTNNGKEGLDYLINRGLTQEVIDKFRIGFAPKDSKLMIERLRSNNHSIETLTKAGILSGNSTSFTDRFYNRIIFPITDSYGRVRGFSGRTLEKTSDNKYINYPETILFKKNEILYNMYGAIPLAKKMGFLYVVEGFMDAIAISRVNYPAVATMGTALTIEHVNMLKRLNVEIRLLLDCDKAGREASISCIKILTLNGIKCKMIREIGAKDADELLHNAGQEKLVAALNLVEEPVLHLLDMYGASNRLSSYEDKERFIQEFRFLFLAHKDLVRQKLIEDTAKILGFKAESVAEFIESEKRVSQTQVVAPKLSDKMDLLSIIRMSIKQGNNRFSDSDLDVLAKYEIKIVNSLRFSRSSYNVFYTNKESFCCKYFDAIATAIGEFYTENTQKEMIESDDLPEVLSKAIDINAEDEKVMMMIFQKMELEVNEEAMNDGDFKTYMLKYIAYKKKAVVRNKSMELR